MSELKLNTNDIQFIIITQVVLVPIVFGISLFTSAAANAVICAREVVTDYPLKPGSVPGGPGTTAILNNSDWNEMDCKTSTEPHSPCLSATSQYPTKWTVTQQPLPTIKIGGPSRYDLISTSKLVTITYSVNWQNMHIPKGVLPKISWIGGSFISNPTNQVTNITFDVVGMSPGSNATLPITVLVTDVDGYTAQATLPVLLHKLG